MLQPARSQLARLGALGLRLKAARRLEEKVASGARVVCVASGKGGTGKSIIATNLAVLRAARGERVLLVDFDAGLANAHLLMGLTPRYDLAHVMDGGVRAEEALVEGPQGIRLLSGGVGRHDLANPTRRELDKLFRALRPLESDFDLVIIDHGAGLGYGTVAHLAATTTLLVVTNHEVTALSDSYALYKRAHLVNPAIRVGLTVNRCPDAESAASAWERFRTTAERFLGHSPEYLGWIPSDEAVSRSVQRRQPVSLLEPESHSARAFADLARWDMLDRALTVRAFYESARRALR